MELLIAHECFVPKTQMTTLNPKGLYFFSPSAKAIRNSTEGKK
jgi:hypothetical protein